jgi:putative (di)nucleoside polyphosphate hydrolase
MPAGAVTDADGSYRLGVGALILNRDGLVFVGRRVDTPDAWQMPQGGLNANEDPRDAVLREVAEETGIHRVDVIAEAAEWLSYDLPPETAALVWGGRHRGQKQKWFALRFTGDDDDIDLNADKRPEFDAWRWLPMGELPNVIVDFKRDLYRQVVDSFRDLAI